MHCIVTDILMGILVAALWAETAAWRIRLSWRLADDLRLAFRPELFFLLALSAGAFIIAGGAVLRCLIPNFMPPVHHDVWLGTLVVLALLLAMHWRWRLSTE